MLSDKVLLERNVIVRVMCLERSNLTGWVDVTAERNSGVGVQATSINWIVHPDEAKDMYIGQEFEVVIKPYNREEPKDVAWEERSNVDEEAQTEESGNYTSS